jgi:hypothetical protein
MLAGIFCQQPQIALGRFPSSDLTLSLPLLMNVLAERCADVCTAVYAHHAGADGRSLGAALTLRREGGEYLRGRDSRNPAAGLLCHCVVPCDVGNQDAPQLPGHGEASKRHAARGIPEVAAGIRGRPQHVHYRILCRYSRLCGALAGVAGDNELVGLRRVPCVCSCGPHFEAALRPWAVK